MDFVHFFFRSVLQTRRLRLRTCFIFVWNTIPVTVSLCPRKERSRLGSSTDDAMMSSPARTTHNRALQVRNRNAALMSHEGASTSKGVQRSRRERERRGMGVDFETSDTDVVESTLYVARLVHVYRIPPRQGSSAYSCSSWLVSDEIWSGKLLIVDRGGTCVIKLISTLDTTGSSVNADELFAECPIPRGERSVAVESVSDSSRYFVLRLMQGGGDGDGPARQAFVGLGFDERNDAFDFNCALCDHETQQERSAQAEAMTRSATAQPQHDFTGLGDGPMNLSFGLKKNAAPSREQKSMPSSSSSIALQPPSSSEPLIQLAPPPGPSTNPFVQPPPPPPQQQQQQQQQEDPFATSTPSNWVSF